MTRAIKKILRDLNLLSDQMTGSQLNFVKGSQRYFRRYKKLSEKQLAILQDIEKQINK